MRMTPRALRTGIVTATATTAITLGAASGALAATQHVPTTASATVTAGTHTHTKPHTAAHSKAKTKRVYVKTVRLASKGHTAKVYKLGKNKYQADILFHGKKVGGLNAFGKTALGNLNGLHVKLTARGALSSWVDRAKPAPKPKPKPKPQPGKRELIRIDTLVDGSMAKVYKLSVHHWQADIYAGSAGIGTLDANGRSASGENNGLHVVLSPDGRLSSWSDDDQAKKDPTPKPDPTPEPDPTPTPDPEPTPAPDPDPAPKPDEVKPAPTPIAPSTDPGKVEPAPAA